MTSLLIDTHLNDIKIFLLEDGFVVDKKEVINKKIIVKYCFLQ